MPTKRKYHIKGTSDFLVLAGIFFFLCLWAVKDAWFPSAKVEKKHPLIVHVAFEVEGAVEKVHVKAGDSIGENQLLIDLRNDELRVDYEDAKSAYSAAKKKNAILEHALKNSIENGATDEGIAGLEERSIAAKQTMADALARVDSLRSAVESTQLHSPVKGEVKEVLVEAYSTAEPGEPAIVIDPKDHFYIFNKSLAVFSFFAFWFFIAIHILGR